MHAFKQETEFQLQSAALYYSTLAETPGSRERMQCAAGPRVTAGVFHVQVQGRKGILCRQAGSLSSVLTHGCWLVLMQENLCFLHVK